MSKFNGIGMNIGNLWRLSSAKSRSISAENPTGEKENGARAEPDPKGPARELGKGWKCSPNISIGSGETYILADIEGPGVIQSIWFGGYVGRDFILRIYWEDNDLPSVECPLNDFFAIPWSEGMGTEGPLVEINSLPVSVNPNRGLNCFWEMPFHKKCKITIENLNPEESLPCFYQINYSLTEVPDDAAYFHAQFRRTNPLPYKEVYTILDNVEGKGQYIGTSMGWGINNNGWWGEGEIKFYIDGDEKYPTICGTGTEDYFGGAYSWIVNGEYVTYSSPYLGMPQIISSDGTFNSQHRHSMYRWHIKDPVRFEKDLKVTIQALGWRSEGRFLPEQPDICSVAYWYQSLPLKPFPEFPDRDELEIV